MVYYPQGMELEVVSELFCGKVNDAVVCRDKLSASGELYTLLIIRDRECALKLLGILENNERGGESVHIMNFTQNDELIFVFPYREERKFKTFAKGQISDELASKNPYAKTVISALTKVYPVGEPLVPEDSLIREFITGGIYEEFY